MVVLAIEAAIGGGSIAILSEDRVLGKWHGAGPAARSENLLKVISELLHETSIDRSSLTRIAVSNGPGSYTGIRIGLATAMGLAHALDIPVAGVSALRAIAVSRPEPQKIVVLPLGRGGYCWQIFLGPDNDPKPERFAAGSREILLDQISQFPDMSVISHSDALEAIVRDPGVTSRSGSVVDFGYDVAIAIGTATMSIDEGLSPFYARETYVSRASQT